MKKLLALSKTELDMNCLLAGIPEAMAALLGVCTVVFFGCVFYLGLKKDDNKPSDSKKATETKANDPAHATTKAQLKQWLPKEMAPLRIPKIQFTNSNWVVLSQFCGWVGIIIAIIAFFQEQYMTAVYFVCMGLSAFLAAHVLRLMEKAAHNLEQQTEFQKTTNILLQKLVDKR
jgi:hypothetical protein